MGYETNDADAETVTEKFYCNGSFYLKPVPYLYFTSLYILSRITELKVNFFYDYAYSILYLFKGVFFLVMSKDFIPIILLYLRAAPPARTQNKRDLNLFNMMLTFG